jgi:DNA (cytosine-5)-methyltransferase 1
MENVRGHLSMGGLSVIGDLTALGYNAEWRIISAASVGANHRRDRLVVVAYPDRKGLQRAEREVYQTRNRARFTGRGWEWWQTEPEVGRVANGVPARMDRLRGLGNAVVPQVAEVVGRLIMEDASR